MWCVINRRLSGPVNPRCHLSPWTSCNQHAFINIQHPSVTPSWRLSTRKFKRLHGQENELGCGWSRIRLSGMQLRSDFCNSFFHAYYWTLVRVWLQWRPICFRGISIRIGVRVSVRHNSHRRISIRARIRQELFLPSVRNSCWLLVLYILSTLDTVRLEWENRFYISRDNPMSFVKKAKSESELTCRLCRLSGPAV